MLRFAFTMALAMSLGIPAALADGRDDGDCRDGRDCKPRTKEACFNLVCYYNDKDNPKGYESCKVAATFNKDVTKDGGEVADDSDHKNNPTFTVSCDGPTPLFNNSARRFTDLLGTRIQGETGPHPAITLPRGALHTGPDGASGDHVARSVLELDIGEKLLRTRGVCYVWTGQP